MLGASCCMFVLHLREDAQVLLTTGRVKLSLKEGSLWGQRSSRVREVRVVRELTLVLAVCSHWSH
jgi:hypothetical protein